MGCTYDSATERCGECDGTWQCACDKGAETMTRRQELKQAVLELGKLCGALEDHIDDRISDDMLRQVTNELVAVSAGIHQGVDDMIKEERTNA